MPDKGLSSTYRDSTHPILNCQLRNASELAFVVGDENEFRGLGMCGNPQIVVADHLCLGLQGGANCPIELAGA